MRLYDVQKIARKKLGNRSIGRYSKKDLIKSIQRQEGNFDCFGTATQYCDQQDCMWKEDCIK